MYHTSRRCLVVYSHSIHTIPCWYYHSCYPCVDVPEWYVSVYINTLYLEPLAIMASIPNISLSLWKHNLPNFEEACCDRLGFPTNHGLCLHFICLMFLDNTVGWLTKNRDLHLTYMSFLTWLSCFNDIVIYRILWLYQRQILCNWLQWYACVCFLLCRYMFLLCRCLSFWVYVTC